jgi:hypothetical protein
MIKKNKNRYRNLCVQTKKDIHEDVLRVILYSMLPTVRSHESSGRSLLTQEGGRNSSTMCHIIAKTIINISSKLKSTKKSFSYEKRPSW